MLAPSHPIPVHISDESAEGRADHSCVITLESNLNKPRLYSVYRVVPFLTTVCFAFVLLSGKACCDSFKKACVSNHLTDFLANVFAIILFMGSETTAPARILNSCLTLPTSAQAQLYFNLNYDVLWVSPSKSQEKVFMVGVP